MQIRSFIIAYALVLAILLFADRRPGSAQQDRYSHVVDLTEGQNPPTLQTSAAGSRTHIIAPDSLIPGTWTAGQIPPERLIAPLVVMDLSVAPESSQQISLDDIAAWESHHGMIPQGAVVAIRDKASETRSASDRPNTQLPIAGDAAQFLIDARYAIGFAVETPVNFASDRALARQIALHGSYVVEGAAHFTSLPPTGSLVIVAPAKNRKSGEVPVRVLAMVH
ncbi:MAG TPA: cyclase family protein [Terriglobales bacterium]|jgi:kynurenine formamidase|nr:cyclase family protein [Terriglobales bacterium]